MAYGVTYITTQGAILAAKTLQSKTLEFSRFKIGSGSLQEGSVAEIKALTDLVNEEMDFDITKISRESATQVTVRGLFKNTDAEEGFWLRELGLYAIDPDTEDEILFAYINYDSEAEYINNSISEKKEHYYDMIITVDNANNVTITVDPSTVYVTEEDLLEKAEELQDDYDAKFADLKSIVVAPNAGAHNAIYRGKDITDYYYGNETYNGKTFSEAVADGSFDNIFPGDYIIGQNSNRKYLVADLNYRLNCGDTECTTPHVLMIPEKIMGTAKMNDSNITTGGYKGSKMYTDYLTPFKTVINNDFGAGHILSHKNLLTNAVSNNASSGWEWLTSTIELMNECMVYGHNAWGSHHGYETGIDKRQLSLFKLDQSKIVARNDNNERYWYWLRDVVSSSNFADVSTSGTANNNGAGVSDGVRPAFLIK